MTIKQKTYYVLFLIGLTIVAHISPISAQTPNTEVITPLNAANIRVLSQFNSRQSYMTWGYVVTQLQLSPGGNLFALKYKDIAANSSQAPVVQIWDAWSATLVAEFHLDDEPIEILFTPDERFLIIGGFNTVTLWDINTGQKLREWETKSGPELNSDGRLLAFVNESAEQIVIWDIPHNAELTTISQAEVHELVFSPTNGDLAFASRDGNVYLCDVTSQSTYRCSILLNADPVVDLMFDRSGSILMVHSFENIYLIDLNEDQEAVRMQTASVNVLLFLKNSGNLIAVTVDDATYFINVVTGQTFPAQYESSMLAINQQETIYASMEIEDNDPPSAYVIQLITVENDEIIAEFPLTSTFYTFGDLKFSHDGRYIVTSSTDGIIMFWGVPSS